MLINPGLIASITVSADNSDRTALHFSDEGRKIWGAASMEILESFEQMCAIFIQAKAL